MSEIAVRDNGRRAVDVTPAQDQAVARLAEWAQAADAAYQMAERLVRTQFVPAAYRNKPDEATAAILAGAEVGLSPMAALRAFDNIQGTPAPKAITLRAIVQAQGHDIRIDDAGPAQATVSGRRKGHQDWQTSTWTIDRAEVMGLTGKDQWKKQPGMMLIARATSEVCRWIASDAIMGMPYSAEEIADEGPGVWDRGAPTQLTAPMRVTAAEILGSATDEPASPTADDAPAEMVNQPQQRKMHALFREVGIDSNDRDGRLRYVAEVIGREVETSSDLTKAEASQVIDALESWAQAHQPPTDDPGGQ